MITVPNVIVLNSATDNEEQKLFSNFRFLTNKKNNEVKQRRRTTPDIPTLFTNPKHRCAQICVEVFCFNICN